MKLRKAEKIVLIDKLIPELSFGFWTRILDSRYELVLWRSKAIKRAFPNMYPKDRTRNKISSHFDKKGS